MISTVNDLAEFALSMRQMLGITRAPAEINDLSGLLQLRLPGLARQFAMTSYESQREEIVQMHTILSWVDNGMPVFELTHGLMAALLLTDASDVPAEDVKMPFPTFVVRFPQPFWQVQGNSGAMLSANYALVHTYLAPMVATDRAAPGATGSTVAVRDVVVVGYEPRIVTRIVAQDGTTQVWERRHPLPETGPIGAWIADKVPEVSADGHALQPLVDADRHLLVAFRRLLINLCLYIAEHGRGDKVERPTKKRKGKKPEPPRGPVPEIWVLGREVKLDRELVDSAKAWTESRAGGERAAGWKVRAKFTVRGHWRNQAYGEGRKERRQKWIAPYWKGEGPKLAHLYQAGAEETKK